MPGRRYNLCLAYGCIGIHHDGGYGSLVKVPSADSTLVRLPDGVDSFTAAALGCRFMTSFHGLSIRPPSVRVNGLRSSGLGGVGLALAVQIAAAMGARVIAVGRSAEKLMRWPGRKEPRRPSRRVPMQPPKYSSRSRRAEPRSRWMRSDSTRRHFQRCRRSPRYGRHLQVGLTGPQEAGVMPIPMDVVVFNERPIVCSLGCPISSYAWMLSMVAAGKLKPARLVETVVSVADAGQLLDRHDDL